MQKVRFEEAVEVIVESDPRYPFDAYVFIKDVLNHTIEEVSARTGGAPGHVAGAQMLETFRKMALRDFGPMAMTVFEDWNLKATRDVGEIVFNLIEHGVFGKTDDDTLEDFCDLYDFQEAFTAPYLPKSKRQATATEVDAQS